MREVAPASIRRWLAAAGAGLIALAASGPSLRNGFAYDDVTVVQLNPAVHSLGAAVRGMGLSYWASGSLYRPLTILALAAQWLAGGGAPWVFHLTSVALYVGCAVLVFELAAVTLPLPAAWAAAALFAAHPVHVEAVGNVVGQGELLAALATLAGLQRYLQSRQAGSFSRRDGGAVLLCFLLGLLCKESAVVLPLLLAAGEVTVLRKAPPLDRTTLRRFAGWMGGLLLLYLTLRIAVLGGVAGESPNRWIAAGAAGRLLVFLRVIPEIVRLLLWPAHLRADYSPQELDSLRQFGAAQLEGLGWLIVWLLVLLLAWRRQPAAAFGWLWIALALGPVSNLLVPSGVLMAERTLFLPSVGLVLAAGGLLQAALEAGAYRLLSPATAALLILLGTWRSARRQPVWRDSLTLWRSTVRDAPLSYGAHLLYGGALIGAGDRGTARGELERAVALAPADPRALDELGNYLRGEQRCGPAISRLARALALEPERRVTRLRLGLCLLSEGRREEARLLLQGREDDPLLAPVRAALESGSETR